MGKKCLICGKGDIHLFEFPSDLKERTKWIEIIERFCDVSNIKDHTVICEDHFGENSFYFTKKSCRLIKGVAPSIFNIPVTPEYPEIPQTDLDQKETSSKLIQASTQSDEIENLRYHCKVLNQKLKRMTSKYTKCLSRVKDLEMELEKQSHNSKLIAKISEDAEESDEKAIFLMDLINNYPKKSPRWSEMTIRLCTLWRFCSPKGYEYCRNNLATLPSKTTISRYLGEYKGSKELCKQRLQSEIAALKVPVERICSLVVDDMAIKEKMYYSRPEDRIFGLDDCQANKTVQERPKIANKMLCFVIYGLSTKYCIPAGYFFHSTLLTDSFYALTMQVMQMLTDCGFIVLRLVTDNFSSNVALFRKLSNANGALKNEIDHPLLPNMPLFLSFDYCHAIKNARSLFLDHDMCSSEGIISSSYLKHLYTLQRGLPIKPVRYLTKKHLYPTNFEKMNVLRAIQVFSPAVTSSLRFLKENGHEQFKDATSTISFMENMYYFFQFHNVSSRSHYIRSLDSHIAPYVDVSDERLQWLKETFTMYIDEVQIVSANVGLQGFSNETAQALQFTAISTYLCIKFLLQEAGFYYVLTRSFSSDAVEGMFSQVRLRGGSNDATDARTAEYAMRQILRCGIVKSSKSANTAGKVEYISNASIQTNGGEGHSTQIINKEDLLLPINIRVKIHKLSQDNELPEENDIYSASVAFLAGYILKKMDDKFHCDECLSPLLATTIPGPLMRLISLQDHGGLTYPNSHFVHVIMKLADIIKNILPFLEYENTCHQLVEILRPSLEKNKLFKCTLHKKEVCQFIIQTTTKPTLTNICVERTDILKKTIIHNKPTSRKILKL